MSKMKADLIISGGADFEPNLLEAASGLAPDRIYRIGETIGSSVRRHVSNAWLISTGYSQTMSLAVCLAPLLDRLEPYWERLRLAIPQSAEPQLSVAIYIHDAVPEMTFDRTIIGRLATLGASLDIDVILA